MKLLIRHHYIIKPDEYMVYKWYFSCQISGTVNRSIQAKYREEEAAARGERDERKPHGQHMEVL